MIKGKRKTVVKDKSGFIYQIYTQSYRKFKYWLGIFFFITFSLIILLNSAKIYKLLPHYSQFEHTLNILEFLNNPNLINTKLPLKEIKIIPFYHKPKFDWWGNIKKNEIAYFNQKSLFLNRLDSLLGNNYESEFNEYYSKDTSLVRYMIKKHDKIIKKILENGISTAELGKKQKYIFIQEVFDSTEALKVGDINVKLRKNLIDSLQVKRILYDKSIPVIIKTYKSKLDSLKNFLSRNVLKIPNSEVTINTELTLKIALILLFILSLYLIILYFTFKLYEYKIDTFKDQFIKVPTVKNIIFHYFKFKEIPYLALIFSIIVHLIIPLFIYYTLLYFLKDIVYYDLYLAVSIILHIAIIISLIKRGEFRLIY